MIAFSQCMRTHGVPEFPEPSEGHLTDPQQQPQRPRDRRQPRIARSSRRPRRPAQAARPTEASPEPGGTGQDAGKSAEVLAVHAHPRSPELPRSRILPVAAAVSGSESGAEGRPESDRSQLAAVPGRAESVPVRPAHAEGRQGRAGAGATERGRWPRDRRVRPWRSRERTVVRERRRYLPETVDVVQSGDERSMSGEATSMPQVGRRRIWRALGSTRRRIALAGCSRRGWHWSWPSSC